jgi:hypothetical protein
MKTLALATAFLIATFASAQACVISKFRKIEDVKKATFVFRGQVVDYVAGEGRQPATIRFKVVETLRGKPREQVVASWLDRDFLTPTQWNRPTDLIVAATENAEGSIGSEIQILHERCSQPLMFEDSKEIMDAIKNALEH